MPGAWLISLILPHLCSPDIRYIYHARQASEWGCSGAALPGSRLPLVATGGIATPHYSHLCAPLTYITYIM